MKAYLAIISLLFSTMLYSAVSNCKNNYQNDFLPENNKHTMELCYTNFTVNYDPITKNPFWSANRLTKEDVIGASKFGRTCDFVPEMRIGTSMRSHNNDYTNSGYSRGHMVPNGDAPTPAGAQETCILTNIVPQKQLGNNGGIWKQFEESAQKLAVKEGYIYIVSGPLFIGKIKTISARKIAIPTKLFKMIYSDKQQKAVVLTIDNIEHAQGTIKTYTVSEFENKYKIKLMGVYPPLLDFKY